METVRNLSIFFNTTLDDLLGLNEKKDHDIASDLAHMMEVLESSQSLAFHGESMNEESRELLRISLENSMKLANQIAKKKFTPNKYKR